MSYLVVFQIEVVSGSAAAKCHIKAAAVGLSWSVAFHGRSSLNLAGLFFWQSSRGVSSNVNARLSMLQQSRLFFQKKRHQESHFKKKKQLDFGTNLEAIVYQISAFCIKIDAKSLLLGIENHQSLVEKAKTRF